MASYLKTLSNPMAATVPRRTGKPFPLKTVGKASRALSKSFHAKVFTLFASTISDIYSFANRLTPHFTYGFMLLKNEEGVWFFDTDDVLKVRAWVLKQTRKSPETITGLYKAWQKDWLAFRKLSQKLLAVNLRSLTDEELIRQLEQFHEAFVLAGSVAYITDCFMSTGSSDWLEELLEKEILKYNKNRSGIQNDIRLLTVPDKISYSAASELELMQIAAALQKTSIRETDKTSMLNKFSRKYFWLENNYYHVRFLDERRVYKKVEPYLKIKNISATLKQKQAEHKKTAADKKTLLKKIHLSPFAKNVVATASLFASWKDTRKSGVCMGMEHFHRFLRETARRTGYAEKQLTFAVLPEIKSMLLSGLDMRRELQARQQQTFFAVTKKNYFIVSGKNAQKYFDCHRKATTLKTLNLSGLGASPGTATGRVKIIRKTQDMKKFKKGEILVINQTTPEFVPVMKLAGAIVTEQGGITSHAAIISRELKKPCVIGTKTATKALTDGDLVTIDGNTGTVVKL